MSRSWLAADLSVGFSWDLDVFGDVQVQNAPGAHVGNTGLAEARGESFRVIRQVNEKEGTNHITETSTNNAIFIPGFVWLCFHVSSCFHHVFTMSLEDEIDVTACDCMLCCIKCHDVQQGVHGNLLRIAAHLQMFVQRQLVLKGRR